MPDPRVAIITGGARGIGRAVGLSLAADGWRIALCYRTSANDAASAVAEIAAAGGEAFSLQCDVSSPEACASFVDRVVARWGRVDVLVNGAGPYVREPLLEQSLETWHAMFDNNLHPVLYMSRLVAPVMRKGGWGRIVSFGMANADQGVGQTHVTGHYIAKAGVLMLTRSLAKLLAKDGITVNAVSPGFIASGSAPEEELAKMTKSIPAGYVGELKDAVAAVRYLISDEARYVNGANIQISGAWGV